MSLSPDGEVSESCRTPTHAQKLWAAEGLTRILDGEPKVRQSSRPGGLRGTEGSKQFPLFLLRKHKNLSSFYTSLGCTISDTCLEGLILWSWGRWTISGKG